MMQATTTAVNSTRVSNTAKTVAVCKQIANERMNECKQFKFTYASQASDLVGVGAVGRMCPVWNKN